MRNLLFVLVAVCLFFLSFATQKVAQASPTQELVCSTHVVRSGETLSSIASDAGIPTWQLATLNGVHQNYKPFVGQVLRTRCVEKRVRTQEIPQQQYPVTPPPFNWEHYVEEKL